MCLLCVYMQGPQYQSPALGPMAGAHQSLFWPTPETPLFHRMAICTSLRPGPPRGGFPVLRWAARHIQVRMGVASVSDVSCSLFSVYYLRRRLLSVLYVMRWGRHHGLCGTPYIGVVHLSVWFSLVHNERLCRFTHRVTERIVVSS